MRDTWYRLVVVKEVLIFYEYLSIHTSDNAGKETFCRENKKSITIPTSGHCGDYQAGLYAKWIGITFDEFKERYSLIAQTFMERTKKE
jgi:hypothetical protein